MKNIKLPVNRYQKNEEEDSLLTNESLLHH
jgi:hypothetical protein